MAEHENQLIQFQNVLLELTRNQGAMNENLQTLSKEIRENDKRSQEQIKDLKNEIKITKEEVSALSDKAKYWKIAFCLVIGACMLVASVVEFGNDFLQFIKNIKNVS